MPNEILLIISVFVCYGGALLAYRFAGAGGLYGFTVFVTITANIEVMMLVEAFGTEMTLGNVLFATTFLITDILSENEGKRAAQNAVTVGIGAMLLFIIVSQTWLLYVPASGDWASPAIRAIFTNTPRMMLASFFVYIIVQVLDVWMYHRWWEWSTKKFGDARRFLWLRNNAATLVSQIVNTVLFTLLAFWGTYDWEVLHSIMISSYLIFIVTTLCDTPAIYIARRISPKKI